MPTLRSTSLVSLTLASVALLASACSSAAPADEDRTAASSSTDAIGCIGGVDTHAMGDLRCTDGFAFGPDRPLCGEARGCDKRIGRVLGFDDSPYCGWGGTAFTLAIYAPAVLPRPVVQDATGATHDMLFIDPAPSRNWEICHASATGFGVPEVALGGQHLYRHDFDCYISGSPNFASGAAGAVELGAAGLAAGWVVLQGFGFAQIVAYAAGGMYGTGTLLTATLEWGARTALVNAAKGLAVAGGAAVTAGVLADTSPSNAADLCSVLANAGAQ